MSEHFYAGTWNTWYGEPLHCCGCGEFESHEKPEVEAHITSMNEVEVMFPKTTATLKAAFKALRDGLAEQGLRNSQGR